MNRNVIKGALDILRDVDVLNLRARLNPIAEAHASIITKPE